MNILFVSAVLPYPLHSGGQIRMYNLLKRLGKRHRISLVSFVRSEQEREYRTYFDFCENVHMVMRGRAWQPKYYLKALVSSYPFLLTTYDSQRMRSTLLGLMEKTRYDVVHIEPFYVWPSIPKTSLPLVVSEHNIEYDVYEGYVSRFPVPFLRPVLGWDVMKLRRWEHLVWRSADTLTAVSEADAEVIQSYLSHPVAVIPNGVDIQSFPFRTPVKHERPILLFVGNFRWLPNREAANVLLHTIWPQVKRNLPTASLCIAGRDIPWDVRTKTEKEGGTVHEGVNDIAKVYRDADILVAPHAISGGTKFKMLEAMASGLPIVTTRAGVSGLAMEESVHYLEASKAEEFVANIRALCDNTALSQRLAIESRRLVEVRYSWDRIAKDLEKVWKQAYAKK